MRFRFNGRERKQNGSALILGLITAVAVGTLSTGFIAMTVTESRHTERSVNRMAATYLAESGIELGVWEVLYGGADFSAADGWTGSGTSADPYRRTLSLAPAGGAAMGDIAIQVVNFGGAYTVQCTGSTPNAANPWAQNTLRVILRGQPLFDDGLGAVSDIELRMGSAVDSYDSTQGAYGGANVGDDVTVATNSTANGAVSVGPFVSVNGDIVVGPGANTSTTVQVNGSASVSGSISASGTEAIPTPSVSIPAGLPAMGNLNVPKGGTSTISSSGSYDKITVGIGGQLIINSDVTLVVKDELKLGVLSDLTITNDATVSIILDDKFTAQLGSDINNSSEDPAKLTIYCTDNVTNLRFGVATDFCGNIYAPKADVHVLLAGDMYGGIVGDTVRLGVLARFHYDTSLASRPDAPVGGGYRVEKWQPL
ncbi:MAG: hypothetical protein NC924_03470 [Candidatus Omnitrophica bacterium]|nr:hypothetical protein [Candidatus Omnitrophota bacterium]